MSTSVVSVSFKRVGLVQSGHYHHLIDILLILSVI